MAETVAYQPGSLADFDRLYRDSYARVLRTLLGVLRDRPAAEECVQEAFVRAFQAWPRWRADAPAEAWLHRIALNVALSYRRREKLRTLVVELELEFAPARHHLGVQSDRPPEPLGRDHGLLRCLPADEEDFGKGEDEFAVRLRGHASLARIVQ